MRNCKNVKEFDPITKLCPPCSTWQRNFNKKLASTERQQTAREQVQNQNRNLSSSPHPPPAQPLAQGSAENIQRTDFPALSTTGSVSAIAPPPIDVRSLQNSYNQLKNSSESFKGVSRKFQECFKEVSRVFQVSFKGVSRKCQWWF